VVEPGRARAGLEFRTTWERLAEFIEQLKREFTQASGREFVPREEPTLPAEVPFSRILNLFNRKDWQERRLACRLLERTGEGRAITLLLQALTDASAWVRESAGDVLSRLTGQSFGYDAFAPRAERQQAVRRVQTWWQANRLSYVSPKRRPPSHA
jgi:HEAT repeat protein